MRFEAFLQFNIYADSKDEARDVLDEIGMDILSYAEVDMVSSVVEDGTEFE